MPNENENFCITNCRLSLVVIQAADMLWKTFVKKEQNCVPFASAAIATAPGVLLELLYE